MEVSHLSEHFDLVTPDGAIVDLKRTGPKTLEVVVSIENISPAFIGFQIDKEQIFFNLKSTLAQLGINGIGKEYDLIPKDHSARVIVELIAIGSLAEEMLGLLTKGAYIGKLFAADERRRVRNPEYLSRMFGRSDRFGKPLLALGGMHGSDQLILEKTGGRTVAYLSLIEGALVYEPFIKGFLPTIAKALTVPKIHLRSLIQLDQNWRPDLPRHVKEGEILLVKTLPLHIRTVFGKVVDELLPEGYHHTTASVLEPDTKASGDVYELFGSSTKELNDIPLEFYTLEPYREHVFFSDRDQLLSCIEDPKSLFKAFETSPEPESNRCAVFIVKSDQLLNLKSDDWISNENVFHEFPGLIHPGRQALMVERYIQQQPVYAFLKSIEDGYITSQGILLTRHFPSPLLKRMLLSSEVQRDLKGIYFQKPSLSYGDFFSHEDRSLLLDLAKFGIPVFWVDKTSGKLLQYVPKPNKDSGMFVPLHQVDTFLKSTMFGVYGSNLLQGNFEEELTKLLCDILEMQQNLTHPLLNKNTPIALVTGGGPGVMEVGNRIARTVNILSCANIVDFRSAKSMMVHEQSQNLFIDAKMTYRLDRLVERQAEFNLDFPIFLTGGFGTDFEYALEELRRKVTVTIPTPILLFGDDEYWKSKITSRFQCNLKSGTIKGSEWVSNCFYCIQNASQGIEIYRKYFEGTLPIGPESPFNELGFVPSK